MKFMPLTPALMDFFLLFKNMQRMLISQQMFTHTTGIIVEPVLGEDWYISLQNWFFGLPPDTFLVLGVLANQHIFENLRHLDIPAEWLDTPRNELEKFKVYL
jgi:hypothetical protein